MLKKLIQEQNHLIKQKFKAQKSNVWLKIFNFVNFHQGTEHTLLNTCNSWCDSIMTLTPSLQPPTYPPVGATTVCVILLYFLRCCWGEMRQQGKQMSTFSISCDTEMWFACFLCFGYHLLNELAHWWTDRDQDYSTLPLSGAAAIKSFESKKKEPWKIFLLCLVQITKYWTPTVLHIYFSFAHGTFEYILSI